MINMKNINKHYVKDDGTGLTILENLTFKVQPGELVAIVGPSGSGKSTLMNILGLLDNEFQGSYHFNKKNISSLKNDALANMRNQTIGFVFQQFHLLPRTRAVENVELPLMYSKSTHNINIREKAIDALCKVGLEDRIFHFTDQLSGGQQQRVAIARAIVNSPDLILADEPTGNLDGVSTASIMDLFRELNATGKTIIYITHDLETARHASVIYRIEQGQLMRQQSTEVVL